MTDPVADLTWAALSSQHTVRASYEIARSAIAAGIPGDFVECGVFAGSNAAAMARALLDARAATNGMYPPKRRVHLFDSFTGCPHPTAEDKGWPFKGGVSRCSRAKLEQYMKEWAIPPEFLVIHEGPFSRTITSAMMKAHENTVFQIAVLRLDADLYQSTREALALFDFVSPGGWIIVDDWDLDGCRKAVMEKIPKLGPIYFQKGNQ